MDIAATLTDFLSGPGLPLLGAVVLGSVVFAALLKAVKKPSRSTHHERMLRLLLSAPVCATPVLNRPERKVHRELARIVGHSFSHTLLAQVSMGEFLRVDGKRIGASDRQRVFNAFNAKRVDFLIVDADWQPVFVVEYNGKGHLQGNASHRDAVKRAVCGQADIGFIAVEETGLTADQVAELHACLQTADTVAAE